MKPPPTANSKELVLALIFLCLVAGEAFAGSDSLCIDNLCIGQDIVELKALPWRDSKSVRKVVPNAKSEATKRWLPVFPTVAPSDVAYVSRYFEKGIFDRGLFGFLERKAPVCAFPGLSGEVVDGDTVMEVYIRPDSDYVWRVTKVVKYYKNLHSQLQIDAYEKALREKYAEWGVGWPESHPVYVYGDSGSYLTNSWREEVGPIDYDLAVRIQHPIEFSFSRMAAEGIWKTKIGYFEAHRRLLSESGVRDTGSFDSGKYQEIYTAVDVCRPDVKL